MHLAYENNQPMPSYSLRPRVAVSPQKIALFEDMQTFMQSCHESGRSKFAKMFVKPCSRNMCGSTVMYLKCWTQCFVWNRSPAEVCLCLFAAYAPLVLRGNCPNCSPQEVRQIQQVLSYIQRHYPKEWNKILKQYSGQ